MWTIWDKQTEINGVSAERFLGRHPFLQSEETIFIQTVDGRVTYVAGKSILADNYGIDPALPDEEFIAEYERILAELNAPVEEQTEPVEEDENKEDV